MTKNLLANVFGSEVLQSEWYQQMDAKEAKRVMRWVLDQFFLKEQDRREALCAELSQLLTAEEYGVLLRRFGLIVPRLPRRREDHSFTLQEIEAWLGKSGQTVREMERRGLKRLRHRYPMFRELLQKRLHRPVSISARS